jgi:hypothetical protein
MFKRVRTFVSSLFVSIKKIRPLFVFKRKSVHKNTDANEVIIATPAKHDGSVAADDKKRAFLKIASIAGASLIASQLLPKKADALIMGSTPSSSVVGVKDDANNRINPATEETLSSLITGQGVTKLTTSLAASGTVCTPGSGKKIRVYASRFSLTADAASVSFRFTSGGTDYEKYLAPKTGGLYGSNNHPNYIEGGVDQVLYCNIDGTTTVQINIDYLEV